METSLQFTSFIELISSLVVVAACSVILTNENFQRLKILALVVFMTKIHRFYQFSTRFKLKINQEYAISSEVFSASISFKSHIIFTILVGQQVLC